MVGCVAVNCSNRSEQGFRLFRFPSINTDRHKTWLTNMCRKNWTPTVASYLCETHFEESQFESRRADGWKKLKPNGVPTLFNFSKPPPKNKPPPRKSHKGRKKANTAPSKKAKKSVKHGYSKTPTTQHETVIEHEIVPKGERIVENTSVASERQLSKVWLKKIGRDDLLDKPLGQLRGSFRVCDEHFGEESRIPDGCGRRGSTIKANCVPSLFLPEDVVEEIRIEIEEDDSCDESISGDAPSKSSVNEITSPTPRTRKRRVSSDSDSSEVQTNKKMMPNVFMQCHPISSLDDLDGVLQDPPDWVNRVQPLMPRSSTVIQNSLSNCHSDSRHFLPRKRTDARTVPKTLVCHDYKGGYQADKYLHNAGEDILGNGYTFYNWAQIDIFVYFSHHLITIPPLCWINAGHSRGVKVLGTLITEFEQGTKICDTKIFSSVSEMRTFARSLAELTRIFGFDGWLLNIENKVKNIEVLKQFVPYFTTLMHEVDPGSLVIWYDSVTEKGDLNWQNELNNENIYFFDSCDGIFLNYTWSEKHLLNSKEAAKYRHHDVFVGIDVFGRNMYGGGKFNTYKAAELVSHHNLSMALFAPGWTHETIDKLDSSFTFFEQFLNRDLAFWSSLWRYMYTHPITDYFSTNFYIGLDQKCYNIFSQQDQLSVVLHPKALMAIPDYQTIPTLGSKCACIQSATLGSRNACLLTKKQLRKDIEYVHHLFSCDIEIVGIVVVYFLTKSADELPARISVSMLLRCYNGSSKKIRLLAQTKSTPVDNNSLLEVNPSEASDVVDHIGNRFNKMINEGRCTLSVYVFNTVLSNILEIGATIENGNSIYLGAFGIDSADGNFFKRVPTQ